MPGTPRPIPPSEGSKEHHPGLTRLAGARAPTSRCGAPRSDASRLEPGLIAFLDEFGPSGRP
jgi:hypothetical protein